MSSTPDPFRPEDTPPPPPPPQPYPPQYGAPAGYGGPAPLTPQDEKNWSLGAHLGVLLAGFVAPLVIPAERVAPWLGRVGVEPHARE